MVLIVVVYSCVKTGVAMSDWTTEIEAKWQKRWYDARINEAER